MSGGRQVERASNSLGRIGQRLTEVKVGSILTVKKDKLDWLQVENELVPVHRLQLGTTQQNK